MVILSSSVLLLQLVLLRFSFNRVALEEEEEDATVFTATALGLEDFTAAGGLLVGWIFGWLLWVGATLPFLKLCDDFAVKKDVLRLPLLLVTLDDSWRYCPVRRSSAAMATSKPV